MHVYNVLILKERKDGWSEGVGIQTKRREVLTETFFYKKDFYFESCVLSV